MKYNIITLNDDRSFSKNLIRERLDLTEIHIPACNGHVTDVNKELTLRNLQLINDKRPGEIGLWISTYDCWKWAAMNNEHLLLLEDDAIPSIRFMEYLGWYLNELSSDYDLLSLYVPKEQYIDYLYDAGYDEQHRLYHNGPNRTADTSIYNCGSNTIARLYQGYGTTAILYSPTGARKLLSINKIDRPIDLYIMNQCHRGVVRGYAPKPQYAAKTMTYDHTAVSTIQEGGKT